MATRSSSGELTDGAYHPRIKVLGQHVRSPANRPPSRCGPSSGKHPNIRTSHPVAPAFECSDVRLVGQETRKRVVEVRCPVTVPREIGSLSQMKDDRTNIIVSQQRPTTTSMLRNLQQQFPIGVQPIVKTWRRARA